MASTKGRGKGKVRLDTHALLVFVVLLGVAGASWMLFTSKERADRVAKQASLVTAQTQLAASNSRIADIHNNRKTAAGTLLVQARELDTKLPSTIDKVALVARVPALASKYGVAVSQMDPAAPALVSGALQVQSFNVGATGTFASLTSWLTDLQNFPSIIGVTGVSFASSGPGKVTVALTLNAYFVSSPELTKSAVPGSPSTPQTVPGVIGGVPGQPGQVVGQPIQPRPSPTH